MRNSAEWIGSLLFAALLLLVAAEERSVQVDRGEPWGRPHVDRDLDRIKADTLRVLVLPDPLTWEKRPKATTGLEWELLERFARQHQLPIKAIAVANRDSMLAMLQDGKGDVLAAQLSDHGWAAHYTSHTRPYRMVARALAHPRREKREGKPAEDSLIVSAWSPFLDHHGKLRQPGKDVRYTVVEQTPEQLLVATATGQVPNLLVSDATARMEAKRLPVVQFSTREGKSVPLVFAVRTNAAQLLHALDTWLASADEQEARLAVISAYDNGLETRGPAQPGKVMAFGTDSISRFDSLFQMHADSMAWDWKLLAAVAFKESRFDTAAVSHMGAGGLMQLMPKTAAGLGVGDSSGVNEHILAAARYLDRLDRIWRKSIPSPAQRLKFVLASYNAGPGHVKDAQRLAKDLGLDPNRWDGQVERALVMLNRPRYFNSPDARNGYCRCQDTYWYVRDVTGLYAWVSGKKGH